MALEPATNGNAPAKRSGVEVLKEQSDYLRGTIPQTLASDASHFSHDEYQLLKFHGVYQQDDRDARATARKSGGDKTWIMMVRAKVPGGRLTAGQYLRFDELASRYGDDTLRITTRQCFQLHHIGKRDLQRTIQGINESLITTLGACGDVERNLTACPAPDSLGAASEVQLWARHLSDQTLPRTRAYHEIWLDHEKIHSTQQPDEEPLYGTTYLPRKFKSGLVVEGDNCIDVYSQDIGMVAHLNGERLAGFTVLAGGGMGMTHNQPDTYPRAASPICFVEPDRLTDVFMTILRIQRDEGNRANRRFARMKYLLDAWGVERFREEMERRLATTLAPPRPLRWDRTGDHLGWHQQADGRAYLGVWVENGRVRDADGLRMKSGLRALAERFQPTIWLTAHQNAIFGDLPADARDEVEALLREHNIPLVEEVPNALRFSMACPAMPTCGLAVAESERALPAVTRQIDALLVDLGLADERLSVRMTGCPNGCARPFIGDVGFVGRSPGKYQIYLGGDFEGSRLNSLYADLVSVEDLAERLRPVLVLFRAERRAGEGFGDFCHRFGVDRLQAATERAPVTAG